MPELSIISELVSPWVPEIDRHTALDRNGTELTVSIMTSEYYLYIQHDDYFGYSIDLDDYVNSVVMSDEEMSEGDFKLCETIEYLHKMVKPYDK